MMIKMTLAALSLSALLAAPAFAEKPDLKNMSPDERRAAIEAMSPEQRKAFHQERKAHWEGLSKEEKLQKIEERRANFKQERDQKWESMTDDEKIEHAEEMMKKKMEKKKAK